MPRDAHPMCDPFHAPARQWPPGLLLHACMWSARPFREYAPPLHAMTHDPDVVSVEHRIPSAPPSLPAGAHDDHIVAVPVLHVVGGAPTATAQPRHPVSCYCPHCNHYVQTEILYRSGTRTYIATAGLCLLSCGLLSFLPFCIHACKDAHHICPLCRGVVSVSPPSLS